MINEKLFKGPQFSLPSIVKSRISLILFVPTLQTDNSKEFFSLYYSSNLLSLSSTTKSYTPQQKGMAEC